MKKDSGSLSEKLQEIISEAEVATSKITDPEIRRVAFDRVLEYLLQNNFPTDSPMKTAHKEEKVKARKDATAKAGTKTWLEELIEEEFFKTPKSGKNILEALNVLFSKSLNIGSSLEMMRAKVESDCRVCSNSPFF